MSREKVSPLLMKDQQVRENVCNERDEENRVRRGGTYFQWST